MTRLADIDTFVEASRRAKTPQGLFRLMTDVTLEMGFDVVTMYHHVSLDAFVPSLAHIRRGELLALTNCENSWAEFYRDNHFIASDSRVLASRRTFTPFTSDEVAKLTPIRAPQRDVAECRSRAGLGESYTIPVHLPGEPSGSCMFSVNYGRRLPSNNFAMAHLIGCYAFQAARALTAKSRVQSTEAEPQHITERQIQCAILLGRGLSEEAIANRLGISRETVKQHLKAARTAYGTSKSIHLLAHLLRDGRIGVGDLFEEALLQG